MQDAIYLALRKTPATNANWWQRALCHLTRWRLVSAWCHAGIVCDGVLHHMTLNGMASTDDWTPARWDLIPLHASCRVALTDALRRYANAKYDWFSMLGFVLPWRVTDRNRLYCFELPAEVLGVSHSQLVTPERLLHACLKGEGKCK